jgi:hypothetical protein
VWSEEGKPVFLDRRVPGERYVIIPQLAPQLDQLVVLGQISTPQAEESKEDAFAEGWEYQSIKAFDLGVTWECVTREGQACHRLVQGDRPGEWAYATEPALPPGEGDQPAALLFVPGNSGSVPAGKLLEVVETLAGKEPAPLQGMNGFLYLRSDPKPGANHPRVLVEARMTAGQVTGLRNVESGQVPFGRFPDPGAGEAEILNWAKFVGQRAAWPCVNHVFDAAEGVWSHPQDVEAMAKCLSAVEVPLVLLTMELEPEADA